MDPDKRAQGDEADGYLRAQRRIALLFDVLGRAGAAAPQGASGDLSARVMRVVARHAAARHDFERHRKHLAGAARPFEMAEIFDLVARELPGWCPWLESPDRSGTPSPVFSARAALGRLVTHGQVQAEKGERFVELARAAARLVALGSLGRAACVVAEADRLMGEAAAPPDAAESARASGFDGLDIELFRPFTAASYDRSCLLRVLRFFRPLQPLALLQALSVEQRRERRRLVLDLVEAHGQPARNEALDLLRADPEEVMSDDEAYMRRNLIYLLRRVPRLDDEGIDEEVAILARHAAPQYPPVVVKEAIGALGQLSGRRAEQALLSLRERMQAASSGSSLETTRPEELGVYLERISSALTRRETASPKLARGTPMRSAGTQTHRLPADSLPGLLHELAESSASGALLIEDSKRTVVASLNLEEGRLVAARAGSLSGAEAVYALLETFEGGNALWSRQSGARRTPLFETGALELRTVVLEGLRRRDERELTRAIAPDDAVFAARTATPRPHPDEKDGLVTRDVWASASSGRSPKACEKDLAIDPFRVRRLYLHWVEEGALEETPPGV